jgi:LacI family transcriptional regulator
MGYRPDPNLAVLARNRFRPGPPGLRSTLAYLIDSTNPIHALQLTYLDAARMRAERFGFQVSVFDLSSYPSASAVSNVLFNRGIQGAIVPKQSRGEEFFVNEPCWQQLSLVCCSLGFVKTPFHLVTADVFEGTRSVWREAIRRNYRRIGGAIFRHRPVAEDDHTRYGASLVEQHDAIPVRERVPLLRTDPRDEPAFLQWVSKYKPDAIISPFSRTYRWLRAAGYRVPDDVAFACCNIVDEDRPLSGLASQDDAIGRAVVDFLIAQIQGQERGVPRLRQMVQLEPEWLEGTTLPCLGRPAAQEHVGKT